MSQGFMTKWQAGYLDLSKNHVQVCYRMKTPLIQHNKPHKSKGIAFASDL